MMPQVGHIDNDQREVWKEVSKPSKKKMVVLITHEFSNRFTNGIRATELQQGIPQN